ncbi:MAG: tetratricopeptide repeat protein [Prevotella sp.]|nr:tetratricopeptide repeat protein [Prevotella sp.]
MQKKQFLLLSAASMLMLTSCSKLGALSADNFSVTPNPLETQAGQVPATINGMFPEKYMNKKAVVTVIPELRYTVKGREVRQQGSTATFQGERVEGNDQTISYQIGGRYTMKTSFKYEDVKTADMYLTFDARIGKKQVKVPEVKVAYGIVATSELYKTTLKSAQAAIAPDAFQRIQEQKQQANIQFLIQQANLRKSELKNNSVQEFVRLLEQINNDREGLNLTSVEVSAYASPDGGLVLNDRLASQRQDVTEKYVEQTLKTTHNQAPIDAKYTAQDWEGFQELVKASNIQDKDVILRVLSMYKDPEEREQQIKNISAAFKELADGILPQLRRSRMTINYQTVGRDDNQIQNQMISDPSKLSVEEMLYCATLMPSSDREEKVYKTTTQIYPNDPRAYNNLATIEYSKGNLAAAQQYLQQALKLNSNLPEASANLGLIALQSGDIQAAETYIAKATGANGLAEVMGNLHLAQGNYAQAEQDFTNVYSNSAALAQILNKNYASAAVTLKYLKNPDATTEYLKAVLYARMGNKNDAAEALRAAISKDPTYAKYAADDLELSKIQK